MIENVLELRKKGMKFRAIGSIWNMTGNAVRKALLRHSPYHKKEKFFIKEDPIWTSKNFIIEWGIRNYIIKKMEKKFFHGNKEISENECIILVNQYRKKMNLHNFSLGRVG